MRAWLTPATIPTNTVCLRLEVPQDTAIMAAVWGAILLLTEPENWEQYGAVTPADIASAMLTMQNNCMDDSCIGSGQVNEISFWHEKSTVDAGNPIVSSYAATIHHGFVAFQNPAAITDQWRTAVFRMTAGTYIIYLTGQWFAACGIAQFSIRRASDNAVMWSVIADLYRAATTPFSEAYGSANLPEGDYYFHCSLTGKHASSTSYQVRLSLIQLVRVGA